MAKVSAPTRNKVLVLIFISALEFLERVYQRQRHLSKCAYDHCDSLYIPLKEMASEQSDMVLKWSKRRTRKTKKAVQSIFDFPIITIGPCIKYTGAWQRSRRRCRLAPKLEPACTQARGPWLDSYQANQASLLELVPDLSAKAKF